MLIHDYLIDACRRKPDAVALICGDSRYTYADIAQAAAAFARFLFEQGLKKGDRVATYLGNGYDVVVALFGTMMAGGCVVPIGAVSPVERCCSVVRHCGARVIVLPEARIESLLPYLQQTGQPPLFVTTESGSGIAGLYRFEDVTGSGAGAPVTAPVRVIDADLAAIIYTSGSSGKPKGVTHTHRSIDTAIRSVTGYLQNDEDDVILCVLQMNFSYGLLQLLATFRTGATFVLEKGFGYPYEVVRQFRRHGVTGFAGSPTIWAMILQLEGLKPDDFATVRYITNAAAAIPEPFVARLAGLFRNARIYLMHGLTECLRTGFLPPEEAVQNPTSIGRAMENVELWIEDDDGNRLGPGKVGEMVVRSSTMMAGYWNDPEGTARMLLPGPYPWERVLHTGDLFRTDEKGYFYFVARKDDVIKSRGEKVSPVEVEAVIYQLPPVAECRIVGEPDELLGNRVRAEIVLRQGEVLDEVAVKGHCAAHLEPYKVPHDVVFVEKLPKTEGGKIIRRSSHTGGP